jgi:hypothetical protein
MDVVKLVVFILVIISTILIFRIGLTPAPSIPGYLLSHPATFLAFAYAYYKTKDKFWLIMLASVPPMLVSDMYFITSFGGLFWSRPEGMNTWAGIHMMIISLGCFFYFKKSFLNYANLTMLFATILTNTAFATFTLSRSAAGVIMGLTWQAIVIYYLINYGISKKKIVFSLGAVIWFIGLLIADLYYFYVSHDIRPIALSLTDKINVFSRLLLAIGAL